MPCRKDYVLIPTTTTTTSDNIQDDISSLLNALLTTHDLNRGARDLVARDRDLAPSLSSDRVDLGTPLADDEAVGFGIGKGEVAGVFGATGLGLFEGFLEHRACFG